MAATLSARFADCPLQRDIAADHHIPPIGSKTAGSTLQSDKT
jgi:hypothetical protein